jgi:hypothetical protein
MSIEFLFKQILLEEVFVDREANLNLLHIHSEKRQEIMAVKHVGQAHKGGESVHVKQQHASQKRHSLHVTNVGAIKRVSCKDLSEGIS